MSPSSNQPSCSLLAQDSSSAPHHPASRGEAWDSRSPTGAPWVLQQHLGSLPPLFSFWNILNYYIYLKATFPSCVISFLESNSTAVDIKKCTLAGIWVQCVSACQQADCHLRLLSPQDKRCGAGTTSGHIPRACNPKGKRRLYLLASVWKKKWLWRSILIGSIWVTYQPLDQSPWPEARDFTTVCLNHKSILFRHP